MISPRMPNSSSTPSRRRAFCSRAPLDSSSASAGGRRVDQQLQRRVFPELRVGDDAAHLFEGREPARGRPVAARAGPGRPHEGAGVFRRRDADRPFGQRPDRQGGRSGSRRGDGVERRGRRHLVASLGGNSVEFGDPCCEPRARWLDRHDGSGFGLGSASSIASSSRCWSGSLSHASGSTTGPARSSSPWLDSQASAIRSSR